MLSEFYFYNFHSRDDKTVNRSTNDFIMINTHYHMISRVTACLNKQRRPAFLAIILFILMLAGGCTSERYTELMNASRDGNIPAVIRVLERKETNINQLSTQGKSALMFAASNGQLDTVKLLIERGADPLIKDNFGTTATIIAATTGSTEVVKLLLKHGGDPTTKDSSGGSALDNAVFYGHTETVKALLSATKKLSDENSAELLMVSAGLGRMGIVEALLDYGINPNIIGLKQRTALIAAVAFDQIEAVRLLLSRKANIALKDSEGKSAVDIAKEKGNKEIIQLLADASLNQTP